MVITKLCHLPIQDISWRQTLKYFLFINNKYELQLCQWLSLGVNRCRCTNLKGKTFISLPPISQFASSKYTICSLVLFKLEIAFKSFLDHKEILHHVLCIFNPEHCTIAGILLIQVSPHPMCILGLPKHPATALPVVTLVYDTVISKSWTSGLK